MTCFNQFPSLISNTSLCPIFRHQSFPQNRKIVHTLFFLKKKKENKNSSTFLRSVWKKKGFCLILFVPTFYRCGLYYLLTDGVVFPPSALAMEKGKQSNGRWRDGCVCVCVGVCVQFSICFDYRGREGKGRCAAFPFLAPFSRKVFLDADDVST